VLGLTATSQGVCAGPGTTAAPQAAAAVAQQLVGRALACCALWPLCGWRGGLGTRWAEPLPHVGTASTACGALNRPSHTNLLQTCITPFMCAAPDLRAYLSWLRVAGAHVAIHSPQLPHLSPPRSHTPQRHPRNSSAAVAHQSRAPCSMAVTMRGASASTCINSRSAAPRRAGMLAAQHMRQVCGVVRVMSAAAAAFEVLALACVCMHAWIAPAPAGLHLRRGGHKACNGPCMHACS
jgi:hypothetical protein